MTKKEFILANNGTNESCIYDKATKLWRCTKTINGERITMELKSSYVHKVLKDR